MAKIEYGGSGESVRDAINRMQQQGAALDELERKAKSLTSTEDQGASVEEQSARVRTSLATATSELSSSIGRSTSVLARETSEWSANNAALRENLRLRQEINRATGGVAGGGGAGRPPLRPTAAAGGFEEDPNAAARFQAAQASYTAALAQQERARQAVTQARSAGATPEVLAPLVAGREEANATVAAQRRQVQAAQASATASEQAAVARRQEMAEQQAINAQLTATRRAAEQEAAARQEVADRVRAQLLGIGGRGIAPGAAGLLATETGLPRTTGAVPPGYRNVGVQTLYPPVTQGGPATPYAPAADERTALSRAAIAQRADAIEGLGAAQARANQSFAAAGAVYASSSNALSRHGALTTEFIQALARGDVTLREFGSQLTSTIGKFSGWLVAGAAVYGVVKIFEDLKNGATETQAAVQQLGRFIPGLGGPAGGGSGQIGAAETLVRNISTQFNLPITDVTDAMSVVARVFHNLSDAGEATRAVLAASRLDQVPVAQSSQYLVGIAQSLGYTQLPQGQQGAALVNVIDSLNALQSVTGARVSQTLPGVARAAPAATAAGVDIHQLEALVALGVRGGLTGNQVSTALVRSLTRFAYTPQTQALLAGSYGIQPSLEGGQVYSNVLGLIASREREGRPLSQIQLRSIASALGGPSLGGRAVLPLLEAVQANPSAYEKSLQTALSPRPYQKDLAAVLDTVGERFRSIGVALQNFGSQLAQAGALTPLIGFLDVMRTLVSVTERLASPFTSLLSVVNQLPTPIRDVIGALAGITAIRALYSRTFVGSAAQQFAGRLPGLSDLQTSPRQIVRAQVADLRNVLLPEDRLQAERAARSLYQAETNRAALTSQAAAYEKQSVASGVGIGGIPLRAESTEGRAYQATSAEYQAQIATANRDVAAASQRAALTAEQYATRQGEINALLGNELSWEEKVTFMAERGYVAAQGTVDLREQVNAALAAQIAEIKRGGGAAGGGRGGLPSAAGATVAAAATGATIAAVVGEATSAANLTTIGNNLTRSGTILVPPPGPRLAGTAAPAQGSATRYVPPGRLPPIADAPAGATAGLAESAGLFAGVAGAASKAGDAVTSRLQSIRQAVRAEGGAGSFLAARSGYAPAAGLVGLGLFGSSLPSGVSNTATSAFGGALIAQLLGAGPVGIGIGAVAGTALSDAQAGLGSTQTQAGLAGAATGAAIGSVVPGLGTLTGAAIGFVGGSLLGGALGGGGQSSQDQQTASEQAAELEITKIRNSQSEITQFGSDFSNQLAQAFGGSGQAASNASAKVQTILQGLTAQLTLFGAASRRGQQASAELGQVVSATADTVDTNPGAAQQLLQGAQSAIQGVVTRTSALLKYGDPKNYNRVVQSATATLSAIGDPVNQTLQDYQQQLAYNQGLLNVRHGGGTPTQKIGAIGQNVTDTLLSGFGVATGSATPALEQANRYLKDKVAVYKDVAQYVQFMIKDALDQMAQAEVSAKTSYTTAKAQIASSRTADPRQQAADALQAARSNITAVQHKSGLSPRAEAVLEAPFDQQQQQALQAKLQAQVGDIQAKGAGAIAQIPTVFPLQRAQAALQSEQSVYAAMAKFMSDHSAAKDPIALAQEAAKVEDAKQAVADAAYQTATDLLSAQAQLATARARGDASVAALAQITLGQGLLGIARTPGQRDTALATIISGQTAGVEAARQINQTQSQLAQAREYGDPVAQARTVLHYAQTEAVQNEQERLQRLYDIQTAQNNLGQAIADRYLLYGQLAASQTSDPVQQALDLEKAAAQAFAHTKGVEPRARARTQLNQTKLQYEQALISQRESTTDFQFQMQQITAQQAVQQLRDLLKLQGITRADRQSILEQIRRYQLGLESPIGGTSQFDLAPGNIRLPTYYDVAHSIGRGSHRIPSVAANNTIDASATYNFYLNVNRRADVAHVADVLDRATGGHLRQRLRSAGVR